jgi:UDP-N-acetylmuramoyl-tripeptide--D-alanyl-D-alanine ligase
LATPIGANQARLDARAAAEVTRGRLLSIAPRARVACGVTTDSRAVVPGGAFVALKGQHHDGHAFLRAAIDAGAVLVIVERGRAPEDPRADAVEVDDTLSAWGALAAAHLRAWRRERPDARVVGITGSAGKTTTKELCAALLRTTGECHATTGNLNNRVGLPAVAFQVEAGHRFAVFEMGMSLRGEIAALAAIAQPDVALVTNVGLAHAEGLGGTVADVAREKGAIYESLRPGGTAVVNADDGHALGERRRVPAGVAVTSFGRSEGAQVRLLERQTDGATSRVRLERFGVGAASFALSIPGEAAALDFVAALAAAEAALGHPLPAAQIVEGLRHLRPIPGRMRLRRLRSGVLVLDDAYNANPASVRAAIATLQEVAEGRRVAVLGEMRELGPAAEREHEALGEVVADAHVGLLVSCGGLADLAARAASRRGVPVVFADGAEQAARIAVDRVLPGDCVLVKASRSIGAERVVEALALAGGEEPT